MVMFAGVSSEASLQPIKSTVVATGLGFPSAFAIANDGTVYATSLAGYFLLRVANGTATPIYHFTSPAFSSYQGAGPGGIALDPNFDSNRHLYTFSNGENDTASGKISCSVYRFTINAQGQAVDQRQILRIRANPCAFEAGGKMAFGPDGKLYIGVGTMMADYGPDPSLSQPQFQAKAQNWNSQVGKILRINRDGSFPRDNPKPKGIWAKGVRNAFGFAWDMNSPKPQNMWESEPGPDCNDEINLVTKSVNLGWGSKFSCTKGTAPKNTNQNGDHIKFPKAMLQPAATAGARPPTPTGLQLCDVNCPLAGYSNRLLVATFQPGTVVTWNIAGGKKRNVLNDQRMSYMHGPPITAMEKHINGSIYIADATGMLSRLTI
ncbi:hypothetical protein BASA81_004424 [Batrachochytrium salamandrivorans]|nr:hypothetical protein BASA81_004424 [Batrachochytrium salamandrivorans]